MEPTSPEEVQRVTVTPEKQKQKGSNMQSWDQEQKIEKDMINNKSAEVSTW